MTDRLLENKTLVAEGLSSCIKTALTISELVAKDQGAQLSELSSSLISKEPLITSTCTLCQQHLPKSADAFTKSLTAVDRPVNRLLRAAAQLEALLAEEEPKRRLRSGQ